MAITKIEIANIIKANVIVLPTKGVTVTFRVDFEERIDMFPCCCVTARHSEPFGSSIELTKVPYGL
jgi:hypothetical protein